MNGRDDVCRAITFINYHIPLTPGMECRELEKQYSTVGFFDGMITERLEINYEKEGLKELWRYGLKRTAESKGHYSYQNIFCFSRDDWNLCEDLFFWAEETNEKFPLTFVVFLQLKDYVEKISEQCILFDEKVHEKINEKGIVYTYGTVDKNDFVVCIKCRKYEDAVTAIKRLHETKNQVIYSYTVFSVAQSVLEEVSKDDGHYLYNEEIKSICLKGIANSFDSDENITLDRKYFEFSSKLVERLYGKPFQELQKPDYDFEIYDILGDDDFRLIARDVKLGNILRQFAPGGLLCYNEKEFQYYLFSSGLVLNRRTNRVQAGLSDEYINNVYGKMKEDFSARFCDELQQRMNRIQTVMQNYKNIEDEKEITCFQAIWQLLQSLKTLEMAPAKKYDFWSLYHPLSQLVGILEEKCKERAKGREVFLNEAVYEFIHKISMTFHGTLRTDIQFFQIRDFNVTIHYAPSKLRAFYALWTLVFSDYYNEFCDSENRKEYSFVFSPGMFKCTYVRELIVDYEEKERLMLITTPERELYLPKWISVIIGHEVSHFVGGAVRNREERHKVWIQACARILQLEMHALCYKGYPVQYKNEIEKRVAGDSYLFNSLKDQLLIEEKRIRKGEEERRRPYDFHSRNSFAIIEEAFRRVQWNYMEKFIADDGALTKNFIKRERNIEKMPREDRNALINSIRRLSIQMCDYQAEIYSRFQQNALSSILGVLRHISSESFADLMVILTLNLKPEDYVLSFIESEMDLHNITDEELDKGLLLFVRLGITIRSVCDVVKEEGTRLDDDFCKAWQTDVFKMLIHKFSVGSAELKLTVKVWGYLEECRKMDENIRNYNPLFNVESEKFETTRFDFFSDKEIFQLLCGYLKSCAAIYVGKLHGNTRIKSQKKRILQTYAAISEGSVTELAQGIEDFLALYESERG